MQKLVEKHMKTGKLLAKVSVTDGPFTEAKEAIGGFAILQASSKAEAIELAREFLSVAGEGECEIRQIYDGAAPDSADRLSVRRT